MRALLTILLATLAGIVSAGDCFAHRTKLADGTLTVDGTVIGYRLALSAHDILIAVGATPDLDTPVSPGDIRQREADIIAYADARLQISSNGDVCPITVTEIAIDDAADVEELELLLRFDCASLPQQLSFRYLLMFDIDAAHRSIGTLIAGDAQQDFLFDRTVTVLSFTLDGDAETSGLPLWRIIVLGAEHILIGFDHLLFLAALLVLPLGLWRMVKVITAFTVAHSITLALAWYDIVALPAWFVETAIALSIAYVAVENLLGFGVRHRWIVASLFGLVHGLGFFAVLSDLGLQRTSALKALLGFNLGVEIGQLMVVAVLALPLMWWWKQKYHRPTSIALSVVLLAVALWWAGERAMIS